MPRFLLRHVCHLAAALVLCAACACSPAAAATPQQSYLKAAVDGRQAAARWWDSRRGWYREVLGSHAKYPLATLWGVFPLFEATNAIAIANPSRGNVRALRSFAAGAERYWNARLRPVPGYAPYPGNRDPHDRTWFDDNGWWGIGFYDAYRATRDPRFLIDAKRALNFIDRSGWDARSGGIWWDTAHTHKAGESVASATLLAASLYHETRSPEYLRIALRYINWADADFLGEDGLYDRAEFDDTPMPYVQGPMFNAFVLLCDSTRDRSWCDRAEALADRAARRFPVLTMGPQYDAVYVRCVLELYRYDHDPRWYRLAAAATDRAATNGRAANGLYLNNWEGGSMRAVGTRPGMLQTHAATTSVLAWMAAAVPPPGG